jgi:hypothetical protein
MAKEKNAVITVAFRLAFPEVFKPAASVKGGKLKYSINMLFPKSGENLLPGLTGGATLMDLRKLAFSTCVATWGADRAKWPATLKNADFKTYCSPNGKDGFPIRDGNDVAWDGYKDHFFIRAASKYEPGVVNNRKQPILNEAEVFGGLICRAQINAFTFDDAMNKGVTFGLDNLQILKDDGTSFSGRAKAEDVFDAFGSDEAVVGSDPEAEAW